LTEGWHLAIKSAAGTQGHQQELKTMLPRENETHPVLHEDEAADLITILVSEGERVAKAVSNAWGGDDFSEVERQTNWLLRIQLLLTAFGRSDLARQFSVASIHALHAVEKPSPQEKP
jgi:hypothetical protein